MRESERRCGRERYSIPDPARNRLPVEPAPAPLPEPLAAPSSPPLRTRVVGAVVAIAVVASVLGGAALGHDIAGLGVAVVVGLAWALTRRGETPSPLGRPRGGWRRMLGRGVAWGAGLQVVSTFAVEPLAAALFGAPPDLSAFAYLRGDPSALAAMLGVTWGLVVWIEEGLFRATVLPALGAALGLASISGAAADRRASVRRALAIGLAAAGFALAHVYQGASGVLATGIAGVALGVLFAREDGRLWAPVVAHGTANTLALVALYAGWGT